MDDANTRTCPLCAEAIKPAARICPYCHAQQRKSVVFANAMVPWLVWPVVLFVVIGGFMLAVRLFDRGRDFAPFRAQFSIVSSSMELTTNQNGRSVTTVGMVRNDSDYAWKEVQLEVRYFDRNDKLVDVGAQGYSDVTVQPHSESAFRVRTLADQPESAYASHKVYVRSAKDIRRWP